MKLFVTRAVLEILEKNLVVSGLISSAIAFVLYFQLHKHLAEIFVWLWVIFLVLSYLARYAFSRYRHKHFDDGAALKGFRIGSLVSGLAWGCCSYFFYLEADAITGAYISFTLAGLAAGASSSLAADKYAFFFFTIPLLVPNILANFLIASEITVGMAIMEILYLSFLSLSARNMRRTLIENLHLQKRAENSEKKAKRLAFFDQLTGLPNRFLFEDRLRQVISKHDRKGDTFALLFIDLDGFKAINDQFGHHSGDELLQALSKKFQSVLRSEDTCARIGGDEFMVILPSIDREGALAVSQKLLDLASIPVPLSAGQAKVSASIGLAMFPEHAQNQDDLVISADQAMYRAKLEGKNKVAIYESN